MGINDIAAAAFQGATAKVSGFAAKARRNAILYSLAVLSAIAAIIFAASASLLALEPHVGMVYARLILAGVFAAVVAAVALTLWLSGRSAAPAVRAVPLNQAQAARQRSSAQFAQLAMIVEAVLLGYSMARKR